MPVKLWCPDMGRKAGVILARGPNRDGSKGFQLRRTPFHQLPRSPSDLDLAAAECTAELPLAAKKRHLKSELAALQQQAEATQMLRELQAVEDAEEAAATPDKPLLPVLKLRLVPACPPTAAKPPFSRSDVRVVKRFDPTRVPAASLYRSATGEETWEPCAVESYDAPTGKFWIEWGAKQYGMFLTAMVPLLRDFAAANIEGRDVRNVWEGAVKTPARVVGEIKAYSDDRQTGLKTSADLISTTATIIPLPGSGNITRVMDYLDSYNRGNEGDVFNPYQALVEGSNKNDNER